MTNWKHANPTDFLAVYAILCSLNNAGVILPGKTRRALDKLAAADKTTKGTFHPMLDYGETVAHNNGFWSGVPAELLSKREELRQALNGSR